MQPVVLVPLDKSALAERALPFAATLARALRTEILLLHAADNDPLTRNGAEAYLTQQAAQLRGEGIVVTTRAVCGNIVEAIAAEADRRPLAAIVLATHGRALLGHGAGGSVADELLLRLAVPILVVRPWHTADACRYLGPGTPIIVPLDGSVAAETALLPAQELASALGGPLTLVRVVRPQGLRGQAAGRPVPGGPIPYRPCRERDVARAYLDRLICPAGAGTVVAKVVVESEEVAGTIVDLAERDDRALIVMTTRGMTNAADVHLGSVARDVLWRGSNPIILIGPTEATVNPTETSAIGRAALPHGPPIERAAIGRAPAHNNPR